MQYVKDPCTEMPKNGLITTHTFQGKARSLKQKVQGDNPNWMQVSTEPMKPQALHDVLMKFNN